MRQAAERWTWRITLAAGLCCGALWFAAKVPALGRLLVVTPPFRGDLYENCPVADFGEDPPLPVEEPALPPPGPDMEVFWLGDSFSYVGYGHPSLLAHAAEVLPPAVGFGRLGDPSPLRWLDALDEPPPRLRLVVIASAERALSQRWRPAHVLGPARGGNAAFDAMRRLRTHLFLDNDRQVRYLLSRLPGAWSWTGLLATAQYRLLGEVCGSTTSFSDDPPMLFLPETLAPNTPESFFREHGDQEIADIADHLAALREALRTRFGAELVVAIAPNKESLYHNLFTEVPYDHFVPRVNEALRARGIPVADLFQALAAAAGRGALVYRGGDTHWNEEGALLAAGALLPVLREALAPVRKEVDTSAGVR
ncbi:MAG: hypothetical protein FJ098_11390 [Deltaproteobacteria bacterium]|nr:hypothetical protein [Deltaproteobacteria bacterium]